MTMRQSNYLLPKHAVSVRSCTHPTNPEPARFRQSLTLIQPHQVLPRSRGQNSLSECLTNSHL